MATKKKASTKKKGPKGKKARAKAKLERQWGELVDETEQEESRRIRRGKSRLQKKKRAETTTLRLESQVSVQPEESSDDESDHDQDNSDGAALTQLLQSIHNKSRQRSSRSQRNRQLHDNTLNEQTDSESEQERMDVDDGYEDRSCDDDIDEEQHTDEDELGNDSSLDPFSSHFHRDPLPEQEDKLLKIVAASQQTRKVSLPLLERSLDMQLSETTLDNLKLGSSVDQDEWLNRTASLFACSRQVLKKGWKSTNRSVSSKKHSDGHFSSLQSTIFPPLAVYADALVTAADSRENRDAIHNILYLHVLNHILTSRSRIQRNNKKAKQAEDEEDETMDDDVEKLRDQGFTRPSVLILLPTRGTCQSFLKEMLALLGDACHVDNMDRFEQEYGPPPIEDEGEGNARHREAVLESKGQDWQELFGDETNDDDDFKIGVTFTPKAAGVSKQKGSGVAVKLYSDFYKSDLILASPLRLKMSFDASDEDEQPDVDFLSSIEICVVARADVLLMQNWDHVNGVLEVLNQQPKKNNDTDFGRVRNYLLAGQATHWRQLIITSSLSDAHINATFKRHAKSIAGRLKLLRRTPVEDASLCNVLVRVKQVFQRIPCTSFATQGDDRLRFFEQRILPQIQRQSHTMLFIPSYFDFVMVRNLLLKKEMDFCSVTEYARVSEVSRGRARFVQGIKPLLLYTGRAHFFSRHVIKGVRHLILYSLPEYGDFYSGLVNMLGLNNDDMDETELSCLSMFTKFDALALERIVGSKHCSRMTKGEKSTFMFCS